MKLSELIAAARLRYHLCLVGLLLGHGLAAQVIYVATGARGAATGCSWADAYPTLRAALQHPFPVREIWVAAGTYRPTADAHDRTAAFRLRNDLALRGGFAGWEPVDYPLENRDFARYPTVLSGDIDRNDHTGHTAGNSYHVVYNAGEAAHPLDSTAVLDGFTVRGGRADARRLPHNRGGGMYNAHAHPTVRNCVFEANVAHYGGGMYNHAAAPVLDNCAFVANAARYPGGGMRNLAGAAPRLLNCRFEGNRSADDGGGMANRNAAPRLVNCLFADNRSAAYGGGMHNYEAAPALINCTFVANRAARRGGAVHNLTAAPRLVNCLLWDNGTELTVEAPVVLPRVSHSLVAGPAPYPGPGNRNADPLLGDRGGDRYRPAPGSPATDAGRAGINRSRYDPSGAPRHRGRIDVGAYEARPPRALAGVIFP